MVTLRFSRNRGVGSRVIRAFTWSPWSHVDLVLPDGRYLGATTKGVRIRRPEDVQDSQWIFCEVACSAGRAELVYEFALAQLGKPYDWGAIFGFALRREWDRDDRWFCSELITASFRRASIELLNDMVEPSRITPRDVLLSPCVKIVSHT